MMLNRKSVLNKLPLHPGIYLMKDKTGRVLYVGKAKNIRKRVTSYFNKTQTSIKTEKLVEKIAKIEPMVVQTETEALVLENELIKRYRPPFNVIMRDDKNYLYIKIPIDDKFPRIQLVRKVLNDGAKYFGPYVNSRAVRDTLKLINKIFPLCSSTNAPPKDSHSDGRACLNYHIGICPGVCIGEVDSKEYKQTISQVINFLSGRYEEVLIELAQAMSRLSVAKKFEQAAKLRDTIKAIKHIGEKQRVVTVDLKVNQDVVGLKRELNKAVVSLLQIRHGKLLHQQQYVMDSPSLKIYGRSVSRYEVEDSEFIGSFLRDYYGRTQNFPREVLLPTGVMQPKLISKWLSSLAQHRVTVIKPIRGRKRQLVDWANRNAQVHFQELVLDLKLDSRGMAEGVSKLRTMLKLNQLNRIEAYDISNTQGTDAVGSMVVFQNGEMDKQRYRRFKIKSVDGPDDFASLGEVLGRRFQHKAEDKKFAELPDLILIDGGKGQVSAVKQVIGDKIKIIGMAKGSTRAKAASRTQRGSRDDVVIDGRMVILPKYSPVKFLLQNIRDEAHRFAYAYHTHIRRQRMKSSILEKISGIGPATRRRLIKKFGSLAAVKQASLKDIAGVVGEKKAKMVKNQL